MATVAGRSQTEITGTPLWHYLRIMKAGAQNPAEAMNRREHGRTNTRSKLTTTIDLLTTT